MSHFLHRLAGRAQGGADGLKPVLPSRFEPLGSGVSTGLPAGSKAEASFQRSPGDPTDTPDDGLSEEVSQPRSAIEKAANFAPRRPRLSSRAAPARDEPAPAASPGGSAPRRSWLQPPSLEPWAPPSAAKSPEDPSLAMPAGLSSRRSDGGSSGGPPSSPRSGRERGLSTPPAEGEQGAAAEAREARLGRARHGLGSEGLDREALPGQLPLPATSRSASLSGRRLDPPPEPTVQVSIGTIEVRAVGRQSPAPRPVEQRQPQVTLEDYLRRRGATRGGRP